MKRMLLNIVTLFFVGWIAAYLVLGGSHKPIGTQALEAYNKGDYAAALPLFKRWGELPEVRKDPQQTKAVLAYIVDIQNRLNPATTPVGTASTQLVDQAQLMKQAMDFALNQSKGATDPSTGADRVPHKRWAASETRAMTIKQLGNFDFEPTTDKAVPADVAALDGSHIRLNGFMIPLTQANAIDRFALVPSLVGCCFGQPPGVQHIITVTMEKGKSTDYSLDELLVEGTLHVKVQRQEDYTSQIFELTASSVKVKE